MKLFATISVFLLFATLSGKSEDFPPRSNTIVTDYTNTLSQGERQALEQKLVAFNDSTSTQIAVVIIGSVGSYDISDYATQLGTKWGIGQKGKSNGVLLLIAKDDHKAFIAAGYGMEGVLPDALCKRVINNDIVPNFKQGKFYEGLDEGTNSIMAIVKGEYTADGSRVKQQGIPWFVIIVFLFIICVVFFARVNSVRSYARTNNLSFWAAWALMNAALNRGHSSGSWGGFSSGGGGWGGGSGGGGFGGFGGGSFGGGGAGGSW